MGIGTLLLDRGLISDAQLATAIGEQQQTGERLDHALVRLGFVRSQEVLEAIGQQFGMPIVDLSAIEVDDATLRMLPPKLVFKQRCVPIRRTENALQIATCDPFELSAFDELKLLTGVPIELVLAEEREIDKFIRARYGVAGDTLDALAAESTPAGPAEEAGGDEVELAQEASVIRLVNDLLLEAIRERATDIHIEPYEDRLAIRYRIDGVLAEAGVPATINRFRNAITSRLKIMANLNIAEKRRPQDGRISLRHKGGEFDLRVSVIPMLSGEGVVLRILNKSAVLMGLEELGMPPRVRDRWDALIGRPHGILLVTGPTGSGKSTTLYASLGRIVSDAVKAITVEDPVEYHVPGVNQIQVNHQVGLDFAAGLRSVLRHDPDIIMIGEIRDFETAQAAVQASLTGHLVFSTLHTNDAPGAVTRLVDMGIEPFLVASSVEGVMAQRLVRRICPACAAERPLEASEVPEGLRLDERRVVREGRGCRECRQSGYRGRLGVYELLSLDETVRDLILGRTATSRIAAAATTAGQLDLLRDDAFAKVAQGITTIAEAMRVVRS
jgi:type II secretory ATPase GspE/PulE/Tfp pilus assembly ATPase PilB-like protein